MTCNERLWLIIKPVTSLVLMIQSSAVTLVILNGNDLLQLGRFESMKHGLFSVASLISLQFPNPCSVPVAHCLISCTYLN
jgi:hypothetical protein